MSRIAARKCVRHASREAVARCTACEEHFCRECAVEHGGVFLCASCLSKQAQSMPDADQKGRRLWGDAVLTVASVFFLCLTFYALGQFLKVIPASFHEGTVWKLDADTR